MKTLTESEMATGREAAMNNTRLAHPRWNFTKVYNHVRSIHPEFFGLAARGERPASSTMQNGRGSNNGRSGEQADNATVARMIQDAIDALRRSQPALSYGRAREIARRHNPALFGLA